MLLGNTLLEGRPHQHGPASKRGGRPTPPAGHRLLSWYPGEDDGDDEHA